MATKTRVKTTARAKKTPPRKAAAKPRVRAATSVKVKARKADAVPPPINGPRRAVFIDVENTSSESELARVLDGLNIDLASGTTEVAAIGNWRVVGQQLGRSLAQRGAHLVQRELRGVAIHARRMAHRHVPGLPGRRSERQAE